MPGFAGSAMKDHLVALAVGIVAGAALGALMRNMIIGICIGVGVCVAWERRNRRKPLL
jgi:large-conductance mechanosensitive channel